MSETAPGRNTAGEDWSFPFFTSKHSHMDIEAYLRENFGESEMNPFNRIGNYPRYSVGHDLSPEHMDWKSRIIRDYQWIEEMVKDYKRRRVVDAR